MELFYSEIKVGDRFRQDIGDLESLKASIEKHGLLHPIIISEDHQLICGYRRLQAHKELRRPIEVKVVHIDDWLQAEHDENEERKDFTVSERVAIKKAIQERIGERRGRPSEYNVPLVAQLPQGQKTRDYVARKAGLGGHATAHHAETIVANGSPELVEAVDKGEISIRPAYAIASLPKEEQVAVVKQGKKAVIKKAKEIERTKERIKGKKTSKQETFAQRQIRSIQLTTGKKIGISKEEFDPDFKGTPTEFVDKHGYVQIMTKAELEAGNDQAAFSAWVGAIRNLRVPLRDYLKGEKFKPDNFHTWIKKAREPEKRLQEIRELAGMIVQTRESIDWLLPLLEAKQTNGEHP